jgi:hypothetical protein
MAAMALIASILNDIRFENFHASVSVSADADSKNRLSLQKRAA